MTRGSLPVTTFTFTWNMLCETWFPPAHSLPTMVTLPSAPFGGCSSCRMVVLKNCPGGVYRTCQTYPPPLCGHWPPPIATSRYDRGGTVDYGGSRLALFPTNLNRRCSGLLPVCWAIPVLDYNYRVTLPLPVVPAHACRFLPRTSPSAPPPTARAAFARLPVRTGIVRHFHSVLITAAGPRHAGRRGLWLVCC